MPVYKLLLELQQVGMHAARREVGRISTTVTN